MDRGGWMELVKDWGLALGITLVVVFGWQWMRPAPVSQGPAPPLEAHQLDGSEWGLELARGEVVVVNFWATWCGPCRSEIPEINAFAKQHPDVSVVGVSVDTAMSAEQLRAASRRLGVEYLVVHDRDHSAASRWGVRSYPTTFVLDSERHVVGVRRGVVSRSTLEQMVAQARAHAH